MSICRNSMQADAHAEVLFGEAVLQLLVVFTYECIYTHMFAGPNGNLLNVSVRSPWYWQQY